MRTGAVMMATVASLTTLGARDWPPAVVAAEIS